MAHSSHTFSLRCRRRSRARLCWHGLCLGSVLPESLLDALVDHVYHRGLCGQAYCERGRFVLRRTCLDLHAHGACIHEGEHVGIVALAVYGLGAACADQDLARLHAELERREARLRADDAIGRLQVTLVLPLGLLLLPGFVLVSIAPVILGWAGQGG